MRRSRRGKPRGRGWLWFAGALVVAAFLLAPLVVTFGSSRQSRLDLTGGEPPDLSSPSRSEAIATVVGRALGRSAPTSVPTDRMAVLDSEVGPIYVSLRVGGAEVASSWSPSGPFGGSLSAAVEEASADAGGRAASVDTVEVCLSSQYQDVELGGPELTNVHVGVLGLEIAYGDVVARYSPTRMVAQNWDFDDAIELFAGAYRLSDDGVAGLRLATFACDQVLVRLGQQPQAVPMFRGNEVIDVAAVDTGSVEQLRDRLGSWLTSHVHEDGRMTYEYWPSREEESGSNNMIRQWMATVALERLAAQLGDTAIYDLVARNIGYNLRTFYSEEEGLGKIRYDDEVKLGAVALAALALHEHPESERWSSEEQALRRTIDALWHEDGSFTTFLEPEGRNDNQNFYPGEALLYWAHLIRDGERGELLERFMRSFEYYRRWHLDEDNRNPAFVPWHTQAYAMVWGETRSPELAAFIFEMNDWLLSMQQWQDVHYPDLRGRFYDPERPQFGVPHASSTGVYMEGLAAAYVVARELGEEERAERYAVALRRGLRSLMQLQFVDGVDMFYVSDRERVAGGVRTTVYDNRIRVDNVQHNLMAVLQILDQTGQGILDR